MITNLAGVKFNLWNPARHPSVLLLLLPLQRFLPNLQPLANSAIMSTLTLTAGGKMRCRGRGLVTCTLMPRIFGTYIPSICCTVDHVCMQEYSTNKHKTNAVMNHINTKIKLKLKREAFYTFAFSIVCEYDQI